MAMRAAVGVALRTAHGRRPAAALRQRGAAVESSAAADDPQRLYDELKYKVGYMGAVSHKDVGVLDVYRLLKVVRTPEHYKLGLQAVNAFYNFGIKLRHREIASRLAAAAMVCRVESEAVDLVRLYGTWLENPPDRKLVYAIMGHFLDAGEPLVVRELAKAVREDWRAPVEAPLYTLAIEAVLRLPENPLAEALLLHEDALRMGVRLPAQVHARLLDESLLAFESARAVPTEEEPEAAVEGGASAGEVAEEAPAPSAPAGDVPEAALAHLRTALQVARALQRDGHVRGDASAATLCSLAWLLWRLGSLPDGQRAALLAGSDPTGVAAFLGGSWSRALEAATQAFGCHWGFSPVLPAGLFRALEASSSPEAERWAGVARRRFGRFYPCGGGVPT